MKRYLCLCLLLLWALILHGCSQSDPSTPGSTVTVPETTPAQNDVVTVYLLTGYADISGESSGVSFSYDETGRLLEVTVDSQVVFQRVYDTQGNCLFHKNTLKGIDQTYDAQGNILTDRTEEGILINTYDEMGRCVSAERQSPDGTPLSVTCYTYDAKGNLCSEVFQVDGIADYELQYTYDTKGRRLTQTYCRDGVISADGPSYVWEYDPLFDVVLSEHIYYGEELYQHSAYNYDKEGVLVESHTHFSDGTYLWSHYSYNKAGNISQYAERFYDHGEVYFDTTSYLYDSFGNLIMVKYDVHDLAQNRTVCWSYDESGTLLVSCSVESEEVCYAYQFIYDDSDRRIGQIRTGQNPHEIIWEYDDQGRVLSEVGSGSISYQIAYVYDTPGNLIQRSHTADSVTTVTDFTYTAYTVPKEEAIRLQVLQALILRRITEGSK